MGDAPSPASRRHRARDRALTDRRSENGRPTARLPTRPSTDVTMPAAPGRGGHRTITYPAPRDATA